MIPSSLLTLFAASDCKADNLFGIIPPWYKYLPFKSTDAAKCVVDLNLTDNPEQFWLVGFGIVDILLRVAGIVAVAYVIYGGFRYITSQGESENLKNARNTIINALIGVAITILASSFVSFFAGQFK